MPLTNGLGTLAISLAKRGGSRKDHNMREFHQHFHDWEDEIPGPWVGILDQTAANFEAVGPGIPAPQDVFPRLRRDNPGGMRYLLRAFAASAPADVRVIVVGQDPYPSPVRATWRAFEDGAVARVEETTSPSLRRLVQAAAADLLDREDFAQTDAGWNAIRQQLILSSMSEMFDGLASQGVILLNAAWTFTGEGPKQLRVNLRLWRPVIRQVIRQLILNDPTRVVLALGAKARDLFCSRCPQPAHFVHHCHPQERALAWFQPPNPLTRVNNLLTDLQKEKICWLPGLGSHWPVDN